MNKKIALCYDFDGTLCAGYMQNQKLIPDCKIDIGKFWSEVIDYSHKNKVDPTLSYMLILENKMHEANLEISREKFINYGKELELFPGVNDWFKRIKNFGKEFFISLNLLSSPLLTILL